MTDDLRFDPPPDCSRPGCCDLSCVWPDGTDTADRLTTAVRTQLAALHDALETACWTALERGGGVIVHIPTPNLNPPAGAPLSAHWIIELTPPGSPVTIDWRYGSPGPDTPTPPPAQPPGVA